jgi:hypothetical protein
MADIFTIGRGDTNPPLTYELYPPVNLTGASVVFTMARAADVAENPETFTPVINRRAAVIAQANPGIVRHDWIMGDTATVESYLGEFEVTDSNGKIATYPNTEQKILITVTRSLG